jgi:hypothetical protein
VIPASSLTLTAEMHERVRQHLFPGDELEAAAILVCSKAPESRLRLLASDVILVPHVQCQRDHDYLRWPGTAIEDAIDRAESEGLSIILLHSHPGGFFGFSSLDNESDLVTMPSLFQAIDADHGSAIMVPDGAILARIYGPDMRYKALDLVSVPGQDLRWWWSNGDFSERPMAFTSAMREELGRLCAGVVGVSGTGSIVAEQLARLGFGQIVLIDFDHIEQKNLNRILNSTIDDANQRRAKVEVFDRAIRGYRGPGVAIPVTSSLLKREAVLAASQCDVLFSCVDTHDGRQLQDLVGSAFLIPLFDVGVTIPTRRGEDGNTVILDVCARIDYVRPGGPTLKDRGVYTQETLRAEQLRRHAPKEHAAELAAGYIKDSVEQAPAVITLNMRAAADLVTEFLARAYPFRHDGNKSYARRELSIAAGEEDFSPEEAFSLSKNPLLARGAQEPLLMLPGLSAATPEPKRHV